MDPSTVSLLAAYLPPELVAEIEQYLITAHRAEIIPVINRLVKRKVEHRNNHTYIKGLRIIDAGDYCSECGGYTRKTIFYYKINSRPDTTKPPKQIRCICEN